MLLVTNHSPYVWGLPNYFPNSFVDFYGFQVFWSSDTRKNEAQSSNRFSPIHNGGYFEILNLLHVSSCKMFLFWDFLHETTTKKNTFLIEHSTDWKAFLKLLVL